MRAHSSDRRGLGVALGAPAYVLEKDVEANRIVVGPQELLSRGGLQADHVSWVAGSPPVGGPFEASVQIRYRGDAVPAVIEPMPGQAARVEFRARQRAIAPGQSVVVYDGDEVLGGGRIVRALP